ncbi:hypothetical protein HC931_04855 [Candidatus Gracilibacteria bacterium]|jgi:hypothetical protein|nr:hypothetical protein [Candidatus Gracilibacteria bacterium]NJM89604.1 hypothetical protein [Hydrococcus sp. RU_2_2]NJP19642.1 hypothetical protein [Hydrococcus sp. CRU_1_1]
MTNPTISPNRPFEQEREIWESLKQAIAISSGFKRWQEEQNANTVSKMSLDELVRRYLRETLATLAY